MGKNKQVNSLAGRIIKLVVLEVVGIIVILMGFKSASQYETYSTDCTETTIGIITNIDEVRYKSKGTRRITKHKSSHEEYNTITVTYTVDHKTYTKETTDHHMEYQMGEEMVICYSPDDPSVSYVEALMPQNQQKFATIVGCCIMALGLLVFFIK